MTGRGALPPFDQVVREHGGLVLRACRAVVGPDDAEDVWSETFIAALRAYPDLRPDSNMAAWLVTIARRKGVDALRARGRRPVPVAEVPEEAKGEHAGADEALAPEVWRLVADLPTKQRHVITYRYLGGLNYAQIADLVGGTDIAARRAAADGLRSLRARLAEEES